MNHAFWSQKKVLITGHTGFKGSWLSLWLQSLGAKVSGYALTPPTDPSLFKIAAVADGMNSVIGDVLDRDELQGAVAKAEPEIVFHLAAQALVRESYRDPVETYAVNVMGLVHLLESVRRSDGVRAVVCVTSDKCYQNREWLWGYRENEPMGGSDPYSSSKGCQELVAAAYRQSFFNKNNYAQHKVAVATARAGNVIGGGDWAKDRLLPDVVRSVMTGREIILRNPQAIRPWQHVLDPLYGYLMLAEYLYEHGPEFTDGWNFAPAESYTVSRVVDELLSLWGSPISLKHDESRQPHEDRYMTLDSTKAHVQLGWKPALDLRTALSWIVEWAKHLQRASDMRSVTEAQIAKYMEMTRDGALPDPGARRAPGGGGGTHLLDLVHDAIMIRDREGKIHYWNRGAAEMYGWKSEEAVGNISHKLLQTQFPAPLTEIECELARNGRWEARLVHTRKNGARIVVKSRWVLHHGDQSQDGKIFEINQVSPQQGATTG